MLRHSSAFFHERMNFRVYNRPTIGSCTDNGTRPKGSGIKRASLKINRRLRDAGNYQPRGRTRNFLVFSRLYTKRSVITRFLEAFRQSQINFPTFFLDAFVKIRRKFRASRSGTVVRCCERRFSHETGNDDGESGLVSRLRSKGVAERRRATDIGTCTRRGPSFV